MLCWRLHMALVKYLFFYILHYIIIIIQLTSQSFIKNMLYNAYRFIFLTNNNDNTKKIIKKHKIFTKDIYNLLCSESLDIARSNGFEFIFIKKKQIQTKEE